PISVLHYQPQQHPPASPLFPYTTLFRSHAVVVIRGRGRLVLGDTTHDIAPFDCVFVAPGVAHQFRASGDEPLGFLCTVDRERDRDRKSTRLNSSHRTISYAVFCL